MVRLIPFQAETGRRKLGLLAGKLKVKPGCWEIDPSIEKEFTEPPLFPNVRKRKSSGKE